MGTQKISLNSMRLIPLQPLHVLWTTQIESVSPVCLHQDIVQHGEEDSAFYNIFLT